MRGAIALMMFLLALTAESAYCYLHPVAYFDTFAYVSLQHRLADGNNFGAIGRGCGSALPGTYNGCAAATSSSEVFAQAAALPPKQYAIFLRFYTVKPLYNLLAGVLCLLLHVSPWGALRLLSAGSFLLLGLTGVWWLWRLASPTMAAAGALCLMSLPETIGVGRGLLPDALLTLLLVLGAALLTGRRWQAGVAVLLLATLVRADALLLLAGLGALRIWQQAGSGRLRALAGFAAGLVAWGLLLEWGTGSLPWRVLFVHSFLAWTPPAGYLALHVSVRQYLHVLSSNGVRAVLFCLPLPLLLALLGLAGQRRPTPLRLVTWAALVATAARILLFPGVEQRYYVWFTLLAGIAAIGAAGDRNASPHKEQGDESRQF